MSKALRSTGGHISSRVTWFVDNILYVMVGILFVVVIVFAFTKDGTGAVGMEIVLGFLFVFLVLLCHGTFDKPRSEEAGTAAILAAAEEAAQEARRVTKESRELVRVASAAILGLVQQSGRARGYSYDDKEQIRKNILAILGEMGILPEQIEATEKKSRWHEYTALDYVYYILQGEHFPSGDSFSPRALLEEATELRNRSVFNVASPEEVEKFLTRCGVLTLEARELIADYRHYLAHHEQRRPEIWAEREEWYRWIRRAE